ncbi:MAG: NosD domain-containing protein [Dinoroseobacter sp.]|nr:NosD domain-containing protein [Dinoroseobacter sp.]
MLRISELILPAILAVAACLSQSAQADVMRPFSVWLAKDVDLAVPITAPIYVPELSRALRNSEVPETTAFSARVTKGRAKGSRGHILLERAQDLPAFGGDTNNIPAVYLYEGSASLRDLARDPALQNYLTCEARHCTLRAPLIVEKNATLRIDGVKLDLIQNRGAMLVNMGLMTIRNSDVTAIMPQDFAFGEKYREFRPFIAGREGSDTRLIGSSFTDLGYNRPLSYGVSIETREGNAEPTGMLVGNVFDGLYYGFYSHHAKNIPIVDNLYRDNIIYGIDPHDYSYNLWIIGNRAYGTKKKHGIIISRGVTNTVIAMNRSHDNAAAGIMLDRHSSNNLVIYNHTKRNDYDGISIYESSGNLIAHNTGVANGKTGLRIRNSRDLIIAHNYFAGNATGILAYTARPNGFVRRDDDIYTMEVQTRMIANTVSGNSREDMSVKGCISRMIFFEELGKQPGFTTERVTFGGDKHWREMLRRVAEITRGSLDIRYECDAIEVRPAEGRAKKNAG